MGQAPGSFRSGMAKTIIWNGRRRVARLTSTRRLPQRIPALVVTPGSPDRRCDEAPGHSGGGTSGKLALFMRPPQDVDRNQSSRDLSGLEEQTRGSRGPAALRGREDMKKAEAFIRDFRKDSGNPVAFGARP